MNAASEQRALEAARDLLLGLIEDASDRSRAEAVARELRARLDLLLAGPEPPPVESEPEPVLETVVLQPRPPARGGTTVEHSAREETPPPSEPKPAPAAQEEVDLDRLVVRAELKARACRLAIERLSPDAGREVHARGRELIEEARRLEECFLWPLDSKQVPTSSQMLELCAAAYDNLVLGARLAREWETERKPTQRPSRELMQIVAEAQSALRAILQAAGIGKDRDQILLWIWVREAGRRHQIYVDRHMKLEDPADPTRWRQLSERARGMRRKMEAARKHAKESRKLLGKLGYQLERLRTAVGEGKGVARRAVIDVLEAWVESGRPSSSRELTHALVPHIARIPDGSDVPAGAWRALRAAREVSGGKTRRNRPARLRAPRRSTVPGHSHSR